MKHIAIVILVALFAGCGGGGGGDEDREVCNRYCGYACRKAEVCFDWPIYEAQACIEACEAETERLNRDAESCNAAQQEIQNLSCRELAVWLGLARRAPNWSGYSGEVLGEEFAWN